MESYEEAHYGFYDFWKANMKGRNLIVEAREIFCSYYKIMGLSYPSPLGLGKLCSSNIVGEL